MKKISISILALSMFMMTACENSNNSRQGADRDAVETADERNEETMEENEEAMERSAGGGTADNSMREGSSMEEGTPMNNDNISDNTIEGNNSTNNSASGMSSSAMEDKAEFAVETANSSMLELELSRLAAERATSPEVKKMAQKIITDHTKMNEELKSIAQRSNLMIPKAMGEDKREEYNKIAKLQGQEFEKEYLKKMHEGHEKSIDRFESMANNNDVPELRTFASKHLPTLQEHERLAEQHKDMAKNKDDKNSERRGLGAGPDNDGDTAVVVDEPSAPIEKE